MVPQRMCVVCRERKSRDELVRITYYDGKFSADETGKLPGRGAYICKDGVCREKAEKRRAFERAYGVTACSDIYKFLSEYKDDNKD